MCGKMLCKSLLHSEQFDGEIPTLTEYTFTPLYLPLVGDFS